MGLLFLDFPFELSVVIEQLWIACVKVFSNFQKTDFVFSWKLNSGMTVVVWLPCFSFIYYFFLMEEMEQILSKIFEEPVTFPFLQCHPYLGQHSLNIL